MFILGCICVIYIYMNKDWYFLCNNYNHLVERILIGYRWQRKAGRSRYARSALELTRIETRKYISAEKATRDSFTISTNQITFRDSRSYRGKRYGIPRENSPRRMKENETEEGKPWRWIPRIVCKETSEQPFRPSLYSRPRMRRRRLRLFRKCFNDRLLTIADNRFFIFPPTYQHRTQVSQCVCPTRSFTRHSLRIEICQNNDVVFHSQFFFWIK